MFGAWRRETVSNQTNSIIRLIQKVIHLELDPITEVRLHKCRAPNASILLVDPSTHIANQRHLLDSGINE